MFEFTCRLEPDDLEFVIKDIYSFVEENGWISKKELIGRMAPHIKVQPGDEKIGWGYASINNLESRATIDKDTLYTIFVLDDPVKLNVGSKCEHAVCTGRGEGFCNDFFQFLYTNGEEYFSFDGGTFDVISHPAHYTEGRKYEPRKVIADWDLSFNLGNAVKYLARAGRKGDKIEDLRKAIQYIEFEIDECSKHSEYEELLNSFKNRPPEEQVKIVEQLKLELNKKYGIGGKKNE